jgi:hypothetical protein
VVDVTSCNDLKAISLCILANKDVYTNLQGGYVSPAPCTWDLAGNSCIPLSGDKEDDGNTKSSNGGISPVVVVILVVVLVVVVLLAGGVIIAIIIYERNAKKKREKARMPEDQKVEEIKVEELPLASSEVSNKKKAGFLFINT